MDDEALPWTQERGSMLEIRCDRMKQCTHVALKCWECSEYSCFDDWHERLTKNGLVKMPEAEEVWYDGKKQYIRIGTDARAYKQWAEDWGWPLDELPTWVIELKKKFHDALP